MPISNFGVLYYGFAMLGGPLDPFVVQWVPGMSRDMMDGIGDLDICIRPPHCRRRYNKGWRLKNPYQRPPNNIRTTTTRPGGPCTE